VISTDYCQGPCCRDHSILFACLQAKVYDRYIVNYGGATVQPGRCGMPLVGTHVLAGTAAKADSVCQ
jgi:hypothetical protein